MTPEIYQEILLEHSKHPRGEGLLADATHRAEAENPELGDAVTLTLRVGSTIEAVGWEAKGSAVLRASCSLMGEFVRGKTLAQAQEEAMRFRAFLTGTQEPDAASLDFFADVAALSGIRHLPARVKCTMLPWRALLAVEG